MLVFTKEQLKEIIKHSKNVFNELFEKNLRLSSIQELTAKSFGYNSYADLSSQVEQSYAYLCSAKFSHIESILYKKHKCHFSSFEVSAFEQLMKDIPIRFMYMPDFNFPCSKQHSTSGTFGIDVNSPLPDLHKRCKAFENYLKGDRLGLEYYDDALSELDISEYIPKEAFDHDLLDRLYEEDPTGTLYGNAYEKQREKWISCNENKYRKLKEKCIEESDLCLTHELELEGFLVEQNVYKVSNFKGLTLYNSLINNGLNDDDTLIAWQTICSYYDDYPDSEKFQGNIGNVSMKKLYMAVKNKEGIKPLSSACSMCIDSRNFSSQNDFFWTMDAHSACMNDIAKEFISRANETAGDWSSYTSYENNHMRMFDATVIHRLWASGNALNSKGIESLSCYFIVQGFNPYISSVETEYDDICEMSETIADFDYNQGHILYLETAGSKVPDQICNPLMMFSGKHDDAERIGMNAKEYARHNEQLGKVKLVSTLFRELSCQTIVQGYDPHSYPIS